MLNGVPVFNGKDAEIIGVESSFLELTDLDVKEKNNCMLMTVLEK